MSQVDKYNRSHHDLLMKYRDIYTKDPHSKAFVPLAEIYRKSGQLDEALKILKKGIKLHPRYTHAYVVLAQCYVDQQRPDLAYRVLRPFISSFYDNLLLLKTFASICFDLEKWEESLQSYKYLLFLQPRDPFFLQRVAQLEAKPAPIPIKEENKFTPSSEHPLSDLSEVMGGEKNPTEAEEDNNQWVIETGPRLQNDEDEKKELLIFENRSEQNDYLLHRQLEEIDPLQLEKFLDEEIHQQQGAFPKETQPEVQAQVQVQVQAEDKNEQTIAAPFYSLTLVDLYCAQGHLLKGLEILEKIIHNNPDDLKIREKYLFLKEKLSLSGSEFSPQKETITLPLNALQKKEKLTSLGRSQSYYQHINQAYHLFLRKLKERKDFFNSQNNQT